MAIRAPVLVVDSGSVLGGDLAHLPSDFLLVSRIHDEACSFNSTAAAGSSTRNVKDSAK